MKLFGLHILTSAQVAALKTGITNEFTVLLATAEKTELGSKVKAIVEAVEDPAKTGPEKLAAALPQVIALVAFYAEGGGVTAAVSDVETIARTLIEQALLDLKKTAIGAAISAVLAFFGVKL